MALVPSIIKNELGLMFMEHPGMGLKPGQNIAKATKNYLSMSQNSAGFAFNTVMNEPYGMNMGRVFEGKLPALINAIISASSITRVPKALALFALLVSFLELIK